MTKDTKYLQSGVALKKGLISDVWDVSHETPLKNAFEKV